MDIYTGNPRCVQRQRHRRSPSKSLAALGHLAPLTHTRVVMLDVCGDMDLSHVQAQDNLEFVQLDLFSHEAAAILHELAAAPPVAADAPAVTRATAEGRGVAVAVGMHLCGALAPRLVSLAARLDRIAAFSICPCCLKGRCARVFMRVYACVCACAYACVYACLCMRAHLPVLP